MGGTYSQKDNHLCVFIDILGYRRQLDRLDQKMNSYFQFVCDFLLQRDVNFFVFSDNIFLVGDSMDNEIEMKKEFTKMVRICSELFFTLLTEKRIPIRGCLSYGSLWISDYFEEQFQKHPTGKEKSIVHGEALIDVNGTPIFPNFGK